jgi:hypothetical protein
MDIKRLENGLKKAGATIETSPSHDRMRIARKGTKAVVWFVQENSEGNQYAVSVHSYENYFHRTIKSAVNHISE